MKLPRWFVWLRTAVFRHEPITSRAVLVLASLKCTIGLIVSSILLFSTNTPTASPQPHWMHLVTETAFGSAAAILIIGSRNDRRAFHLGLHYLCTAAAFAYPALLAFGEISGSTFGIFSSTLAGLQVEAFSAYFIWLFARDFPRTLSPNREKILCDIFIATSFIVGIILFVLSGIHLHSPGVFASIINQINRPDPESKFWTVLLAMVVPAPLVILKKTRRAPFEERRRARMFVGVLVLAGIPVCIHILLENTIPQFSTLMNRPILRWFERFIVYSLFFCVPIITTYTVLVDRILDVRLVIRKTLQYALARNTLLLAFVIPLAGAVFFIYVNREMKIVDLLTGQRFLILASAGIAIIVMLALRERFLSLVDRRFFREQVNVERVLSQLIEKSRSVPSVSDLTRTLTEEINSSLHPKSIGALILDPSTKQLVSPLGDTSPLSISSSLVKLLSEVREPIEVDLSSNEGRFFKLPDEDRKWLSELNPHLLIPLLGTSGVTLGLIALGSKRSDLPFSKSDRSLLSAMAASVSLSLENRLLHTTPSFSENQVTSQGQRSVSSAPAASECPDCGVVHPAGTGSCKLCNAALITSMVPHYLDHKFRFDRRIGRGGMGVVYKAFDLVLERSVAVKTLPILSTERLRRMYREAKAMAALSHPNLALIFGAEIWRDVPLLIIEYLEGGTLADRIRERTVEFKEAIAMGVVLLDALSVIHSSNILHRDIKPSNIGFRLDNTPKLLDFGLARILTEKNDQQIPIPLQVISSLDKHLSNETTLRMSITADGNLIGTPLYLSPEALSGKVNRLSDLWALAISLYETLAGKNPFHSSSLQQTLTSIASGDIPDIREFRKNSPLPVVTFFKNTLAKDPADRPATAEDMKTLLKQVLVDLGHSEML